MNVQCKPRETRLGPSFPGAERVFAWLPAGVNGALWSGPNSLLLRVAQGKSPKQGAFPRTALVLHASNIAEADRGVKGPARSLLSPPRSPVLRR